MPDIKDGGAPFDLSSMISSLMSNPAALSAISSLLGNLNAGGASASPPPQTPPPPPEASTYASAPPMLPVHAEPRGRRHDDDRRHLIDALRPFLSEERCATLDYILKISDLISLMRRDSGKR